MLYYAREIDSTILSDLITITSEQAVPVKKTQLKCQRLLDYASTYSNAYIRYHASDIILHVELDTVYLLIPKPRIRTTY